MTAEITRGTWLCLGALLAAGTSAAILGDLMVPPRQAEISLRGYRASKRRQALEDSALLRLIWPLAMLLAGTVRALPGRRWRAALGAELVRAGEPAGLDADEFVGLNAAVFLAALGLAFTVNGLQNLGPSLYVVCGMFGLVLPRLKLAELVQARFKAINRGLPPAVDLVVMAMVAGSDFIGALGHVVAKWSRRKDPLYEELSRFLSDLQFGMTRRQALEHFAARTPTELVKTFAGSVIEAEQRGTPLVEILALQAEVARTKRFQAAELAAGRAGVLVKLPLALIVVACVIVILGGMIVRISRHQLF